MLATIPFLPAIVQFSPVAPSMMNILLANYSLRYLAGSESWTESMAYAFRQLGHDVSCYSQLQGEISDRLVARGVPCFHELEKLAGVGRPQVIIANHWPVVVELAGRFPEAPMVSTIHGVLHRNHDGSRALEHPALGVRAHQFVAVSDEVRFKLDRDYGLASQTIMNGLALDRFHPVSRSFSGPPRRFLVNSNYMRPDSIELKVLEDVSTHFGGELVKVGAYFNPAAEPENYIAEADVVFGMGRSLLEGVAMGCLGVVYGRWGTGGVLRPDNAATLAHYNYSGRSSDGKTWHARRLVAEIERWFSTDTIEWGVRYVARHHDINRVTRRYLDLFSERGQG